MPRTVSRLRPVTEVEPPPWHRGRLDDRGRRLAVRDEAVDDLLEVLDRADVRLHEEAVLAGDAVALDDLGRVAREVGDRAQLARRRADANDRRQREAELARVDGR